MMLQKHFVQLREEESRYQNINSYLYMNYKLRDEAEIKRSAKTEIRLFESMSDVSFDTMSEKFYKIYSWMHNVRFDGKIIIRPFKSMYEAILDGVMGVYDSGLILETMAPEDGYVFAIRMPGCEEKAFGYVWYNSDGSIKQARQAFCLDIEHKVILKYLKLFSDNILLPALKEEEKIA